MTESVHNGCQTRDQAVYAIGVWIRFHSWQEGKGGVRSSFLWLHWQWIYADLPLPRLLVKSVLSLGTFPSVSIASSYKDNRGQTKEGCTRKMPCTLLLVIVLSLKNEGSSDNVIWQAPLHCSPEVYYFFPRVVHCEVQTAPLHLLPFIYNLVWVLVIW